MLVTQAYSLGWKKVTSSIFMVFQPPCDKKLARNNMGLDDFGIYVLSVDHLRNSILLNYLDEEESFRECIVVILNLGSNTLGRNK